MFIVVFRSRKRADFDAAAYAADDARMVSLAKEQEGFVSFKYFTAEDGETLSISEWEDEAAAKRWAAHPEHAAVQLRGRSEYYSRYTQYSCTDPRVSKFGSQTT